LAIIYLTKLPPESPNRDGYEPAELPVTAAMIAAGVDAFVQWFRQPHLEGLLIGLPERADLSILAQSIFESMTSASPDV
jgi:hypothetical protein